MPLALPEGTHLEVWVVGQPNSVETPVLGKVDFPPYRMHWTDALAQKHYGVPTALEAAQAFVRNRSEEDPWDEGPRIVTRTVTLGPWEEVSSRG